MPVSGGGDGLQAVSKLNPRNDATMFKIFQNVQYNVVQHKKYVKEMTKLFKKLDQDSFRESFSNALHYLFTFGDTSANVDRVIQFVATFCTSLDDEEEFLHFIFGIIFDCQCVSGQSVRYRASQLLAAVLAALGEDASLDDDLCDKLLASQMERLQDTRGAVRCRAALALQRLQNPMDNDDEVTRAYRFHMSCDPSSSVRRAIVISIAKSIRNVPFVMERLCDVDEAVRRAAFLYVSAINVTQLKVRQRVHTLKVGLNERSAKVRRVVEEILIPGWLSNFKGNITDLLKAIRLDNAQDAMDSQHVAGKLLESLFKRLPTSELLEWLPTDKTLRLIPAEKLNKETAWYWRHLAEHLQRQDDDETLETVLPDLVVLAGYIRAIVEAPCPSEKEDPVGFSTRQYVLAEVARLLRVYDAGDPVGRGMLQTLLTDVLTGDYGPLNPEVIRAFVAALEMVVPEVSPRVEFISSLISELREPTDSEVHQPVLQVECTETKLQRARLRVSLNVAMEAQEEAVRDQNYALAAQCKAKVEDIQKKLEELNIQAPPPPPVPTPPTIREKLSDAQTLKKCLIILNSALDTPQITTITPQLQLIFNELEVELFQNPEILETALETVALYGMLDKEFVKENKAFFFAHIVNTEHESLVNTILRCIMDLLSVHGVKVFDVEDQLDPEEGQKMNITRDTTHDDDDDGDGVISDSVLSLTPAHNSVIELLLKIMDGTHPSYRLIIATGLCRLLMLDHLESPGILSRLILLWFNPATEEEDMLRQTIGVFFQTFVVTVEGAQEQIQKAALPTFRALANAPANSPIAEIDQEAVVRFIISLTKVNHETVDSQGALGVLLVSFLVVRPGATETGLVCRSLSLLAAPRELATCADLANTLRDLCTKLPDKQSCRHLTKYLGSLEIAERMSLNKISTVTTMAEMSVATIDITARDSRATTSLPQPIARSTQVMINETVEEEGEIEKSSLTDAGPTDRISEEPKIDRKSDETDPTSDAVAVSTPRLILAEDTEKPISGVDIRSDGSDSSGVSPVKKPRVHKKGNKNQRKSRTDSLKAADVEKQSSGGSDRSACKRTRSQRSSEDSDRGQSNVEQNQSKPTKNKPPLELPDDASNVTIRRSFRGVHSGSSTDSTGSTKSSTDIKGVTRKEKSMTKKTTKPKPSAVIERVQTRRSGGSDGRMSDGSGFDTADETELHTIVYDNEFEQSLLNDSGNSSGRPANVTIPETPETSEESEPEVEKEETKTKPKGGGKKK